MNVGPDQERTLGHAQKDVGSSCHALAHSRAQYGLEYPAQLNDHPLHGAQVIEHRYEETEEEYHRQYGEGEHLLFDEEITKNKACTICGIAQKRGHLIAQALKDLPAHLPAYADDAQ